jgi:hypothetical protein
VRLHGRIGLLLAGLVLSGLLTGLTACAPDGAGPEVEAQSPAALSPPQASLLAEALFRNHEATGATFSLVALAQGSGATLTLEGIVDWSGLQGRAHVGGYVDEAGPVDEIAWTHDAVAELRPAQLEILASRGEPPGTYFLRAADPQKHPVDRLVAIVTGLAATQPENAQLILQNPGAAFLRDDVLRGRDVVVLRYSERSIYWIDTSSGELMRFEGRNSVGGSPVIVDILELGPRRIALPVVSVVPLRP